MDADEVPRAVEAAMATASALGLRVDDAAVVHDSNRLAVRLLPCDVLARIAPSTHERGTAFELDVARRLAETDAPIATLEPRVEPRLYHRDGFVLTLWTYYERVAPNEASPGEYAYALARLHAGMRRVGLPAPHFTDRVGEAQRLVNDRMQTPQLADADRELLSETLSALSRAVRDRAVTEQLIHGEPHGGNLLRTKRGLLFTDLETCCIGPVEFDIAHCSRSNVSSGVTGSFLDAKTPFEVADHYDGADRELVGLCRVLMLAMVAAWRWDRRDRFPGGRRMGVEFLREIRMAVGRTGLSA